MMYERLSNEVLSSLCSVILGALNHATYTDFMEPYNQCQAANGQVFQSDVKTVSILRLKI